MERLLRVLAVVMAMSGAAVSAADAPWTLTRSDHFELYSQESDAAARTALTWFELLHSFFKAQATLALDDRPPLRVVMFHTAEQFAEYKLHPTSDAYYVGQADRDYIIMRAGDPNTFAVAAHEYVHAVLHASGLALPAWLTEGLSEFFSTIRITNKGITVGDTLPQRLQSLKSPWVPMRELLAWSGDAPSAEEQKRLSMFYAQSWALTHMLALSKTYGPRFPALIASLAEGTSTKLALSKIYGKSLVEIDLDAHNWIAGRNSKNIALPSIESPVVSLRTSAVTPVEVQLLLAEVFLAAGNLDRAAALYRNLDKQAPGMAQVAAGLGEVALRKGDLVAAQLHWKQALDRGITDASLCYRYAVIAQQAGANPAEIRSALERAITLRPVFDDARFSLALIEMRENNYAAAVTQFRAMKVIAPSRAYGYWNGLSYSLLELDRRGEAKEASAEAARHASTPAERNSAAQLSFMADTDLNVQFTRDVNGGLQMTTVRIPHGQQDWNPFVEQGDDMRRVEGTLREVRCEEKATKIVVQAADQSLVLTIPDPSRVQMRNAPDDFVCGAQSPRAVQVEYAAANGVVRGIQFR